MISKPFTPSNLFENADGARAEACFVEVYYSGGVPIAISGLPDFAKEALDHLIAVAGKAEAESEAAMAQDLRQRAEKAEAERYAYRESYEFQKMVSNALRSRAEKAEAERNALRQDGGGK